MLSDTWNNNLSRLVPTTCFVGGTMMVGVAPEDKVAAIAALVWGFYTPKQVKIGPRFKNTVISVNATGIHTIVLLEFPLKFSDKCLWFSN